MNTNSADSRDKRVNAGEETTTSDLEGGGLRGEEAGLDEVVRGQVPDLVVPHFGEPALVAVLLGQGVQVALPQRPAGVRAARYALQRRRRLLLKVVQVRVQLGEGRF